MAGKRHHINPRFLLKGFASSSHKGRDKTWVFFRDKEPLQTNIINVGVESNFYTHDDLEADSAISEIEPIFANLLGEIRAGEKTALISPDLPMMIAHFEMRSKHLRDHLSQLYQHLMSSVLDILGDGESLANMLKEMICQNSPLVREVVQDSLKENNLPQEMLTPILMLAKGLIDQQPSFLEGFSESMRKLVHEYARISEGTVQSSHIRSIRLSPASKTRAKRYEHLTYSLVRKSDGIILGDSPLLFHINSERRYKTILDADDEIIAVYLPIDRETVLVGAHQRERSVPDDFLEAIARCSLEYFVATKNTEMNRELQRKISTNTGLFTKAEVRKLVNEALFEKQPCHEVITTPIYSYHTVPQEQSGAPVVSLALQTIWGYQGFTLDREKAESLSQELLKLSRKTRQKNIEA